MLQLPQALATRTELQPRGLELVRNVPGAEPKLQAAGNRAARAPRGGSAEIDDLVAFLAELKGAKK